MVTRRLAKLRDLGVAIFQHHVDRVGLALALVTLGSRFRLVALDHFLLRTGRVHARRRADCLLRERGLLVLGAFVPADRAAKGEQERRDDAPHEVDHEHTTWPDQPASM